MTSPSTSPQVCRVTAEHCAPGTAVGIGTPAPRLSWRVTTSARDWLQERAEVELLDAGGAVLASSGPLDVSDQVLVPWPFAPLVSAQRAAVRVRVAGAGEELGPWSEAEPVEAGLLEPDQWSARAVTADAPGPLAGGPGTDPYSAAPRMRTEFTVGPDLVAARLRLTAHGLVIASLNGQRVGDEELAPGWTTYGTRLRYRTHDVTALLTEGPNALGALLGNGWFRGRLTWLGLRGVYGDRRALLAQLELSYADGRTERVVTGADGGWRSAPSEVLADDLYDGETVDLRLRDDAWTRAGYDDSAWTPVTEVELDVSTLVAASSPPVRRIRALPAVRVWPSPEQGVLVDFGEDVVGWVRLRVPAGTGGGTVTVRHAEVLEDGHLGVRPLRSAEATDRYLLPGTGDGAGDGAGGAGQQQPALVLEPRFTFHGFRYAEVSGAGDLRPQDLEAVVLSSDLERTGWFDCSEPDLVTFSDNVLRGMQGNFLDVPTDCPQRDERLGWTGDIQVFSPTASFLADCSGFLGSWLEDLAAEQSADGTVPFVVPNPLPGDPVPAAAWGDAAAVVPWVLYQRTGDLGVLERQWPSMSAWVDRLAAAAGEDHLWSGGFQFGDWLDPTAPPEDAAAAQADPDVVATACFARSARLVAWSAQALGREQDAARYGALADAVARAWAQEYATASGRVLSDSPTVYAQALAWDLLTDSAQRARAGDRLADLVRTGGYRISTGFVGTPLVTDALVATGHVDVAYRLLLQRACPSWLYPVTMGATTVWERWDSMLPDGSINPGEMTSFNHYALGAVADWLHRCVAGLAPAAPGYRRLRVTPLPGGGLTRASARHTTPYGEASVAWRVEGATWHLDVVVPPGTRAHVHLPDGSDALEVGSGEHAWSLPWPDGVRAAGASPDRSPVGLDSPVRDLLDDAAAWAAASAAMVEAGIGPDDAAVARRTLPYLEGTVRELALVISAPGHISEGEVVLEAVAARLRAVGHG